MNTILFLLFYTKQATPSLFIDIVVLWNFASEYICKLNSIVHKHRNESIEHIICLQILH